MMPSATSEQYCKVLCIACFLIVHVLIGFLLQTSMLPSHDGLLLHPIDIDASDPHAAPGLIGGGSSNSTAAVAMDMGGSVSSAIIQQGNNEKTVITAVVKTAGELGHNLSLLPYGLKFKRWAESKFEHLEVNLFLHQSVGNLRKSKPTYDKIRRCFPQLGKTYGFLQPARMQDWDLLRAQERLFPTTFELFNRVERSNVNAIQALLEEKSRTTMAQNDTSLDGDIQIPPGFDFPFLHLSAGSFASPSRSEVRRYYAFNDSECSNSFPRPGETVLHIRGFRLEVGQNDGGLRELDPNRMASHLLSHLRPGSHVAILSRFPDSDDVAEHVVSLASRGLHVRVVSGQSDVEDLCFMMHASSLVGLGWSTFFRWAARLSRAAERIDMYLMHPKNKKNGSAFRCLTESYTGTAVSCHRFEIL